MSDSEAGSTSGDFENSVQEMVHGLGPTEGPPPAQLTSQENQPSTAALLASMNKKLDVLQSQYDLSSKNNEALTSLVQAQQQQMIINQVRVDALSTELEQHKELVKKKEQEDKATASQVLLHLQKIFPDWITKDSPDKLRGFASSKSPSPKMIIPFDTENSWLAPPPPNAPDVVGSFPHETEFPTSDKNFVPKGENHTMGTAKNWPNVIPFEFKDKEIQTFLTANSLVQNNKIILDPEIFAPAFITMDPNENFHILDSLSRKSLIEIAIVDHVLAQGLERFKMKVDQANDNPISFNDTDWPAELSLYQYLFEIAYSSNLRAKHTTTSLFITNKRRARNFVLDKCYGKDISKTIMKGTNFASPAIFGSIPNSHRQRIRDSVCNKDQDFMLRPKKFSGSRFSPHYPNRSTSYRSQRIGKRNSQFYDPQPAKRPHYPTRTPLPSTSSSQNPRSHASFNKENFRYPNRRNNVRKSNPKSTFRR